MKIAIFSDVHSNLPALEAVLTDIKRQGVSMQVCLGDIVGYNAEPALCVERVRRAFDLRATQKKILAAGLPKVLAWRLELGL
jgi:predicted phosphodiesterase